MHPAALPLLALLLLLLTRAAWVVRHLWYAGSPALGRDAVPLLAERRAHDWVGAPSSDLVARAVRALSSDTDRLLFVRMRAGADLRCDVLGSTGNLYAVVIRRVCSCTCPDWARSGGNCKHLLYAKLRVLKLPRESPLLWQTAYTSIEITYMLAHLAHPRAVEGRATGVVLRALGEEAERTPVGLGAPCPVCFCDLEASEPLVHCRAECAQLYHAACIEAYKAAEGGKLKCALCRAAWLETGVGARVGADGYTNYGSLTAQARVRRSRSRTRC